MELEKIHLAALQVEGWLSAAKLGTPTEPVVGMQTEEVEALAAILEPSF